MENQIKRPLKKLQAAKQSKAVEKENKPKIIVLKRIFSYQLIIIIKAFSSTKFSDDFDDIRKTLKECLQDLTTNVVIQVWGGGGGRMEEEIGGKR